MATLLKSTGSCRLISENFIGTDLSGVSGAVNRTLDVGRTPNIITLERETLRPTTDYTVAGTVVTFLVKVYNQMKLTAWT